MASAESFIIHLSEGWSISSAFVHRNAQDIPTRAERHTLCPGRIVSAAHTRPTTPVGSTFFPAMSGHDPFPAELRGSDSGPSPASPARCVGAMRNQGFPSEIPLPTTFALSVEDVGVESSQSGGSHARRCAFGVVATIGGTAVTAGCHVHSRGSRGGVRGRLQLKASP